jgi:hypothetical protein
MNDPSLPGVFLGVQAVNVDSERAAATADLMDDLADLAVLATDKLAGLLTLRAEIHSGAGNEHRRRGRPSASDSQAKPLATAALPDRSQRRFIAERLNDLTTVIGNQVRIDHPSLGSHPGHEILAGFEFHGGCIAVEPTDRDPIAFSQDLIRTAIHLGAARHVAICEGTSFGLDTTRIT